jgi:lipid-A-disaccharide synthase
MMDPQRTVMMVAGEPSGDLYGAKVVEEMASLSPGVKFYGIGGNEMERRGVTLLASSADLAVVGVTEIAEKIGHIWIAWRRTKRFIEDHKPQLAVLIDYPGFNLRLAKTLNNSSVPILYYVSPQVWAWHPGRIKKIAKRVAKMAVILPFEASLYQREGVDAEFVGHPLLDILEVGLTREEACRRLGVSSDDLLIGLLPGSRGREVKVLLPSLLGAAEIIARDFPLSRFMIPLASSIGREGVQGFLERSQLPCEVVEGKTFEVMKAADLLLVTSGTATLEGAIAGCPMVIIYRLSPMTYLIGRILVKDHFGIIKVKCIGLANIVVGKKVVPELMQGEVTPQRIALEAKKILLDHDRREEITDEFKLITDKLGGKGASQRVARIALRMMGVV